MYYLQHAAEDNTGQGPGGSGCAILAQSAVVSKTSEHANSRTSAALSQERPATTANRSDGKASSKQTPAPSYLQNLRGRLRSSGFSKQAVSILCSSWRAGTKNQYATYINKWRSYARKRLIDPIHPSVSEAVNFLTLLFQNGLSYSSICIARSALSCYLEIDNCEQFGAHRLVKRFMKGVFELRPAFPKYAVTWDVDLVLRYLELLFPLDKLTLKELSYKVIMLIALLSGQRCQTLHSLTLPSMTLSRDKCVFVLDVLLKQSKRGKHMAPVELLAYTSDEKLCVVAAIREYIRRTKDLRGTETQLFISYQKPYGPISKSTVARWIRDVLHRAGVDTSLFGAHSTRAASTSAAVAKGTPMDTVLKAAGWSGGSTFSKFYKKAPVANMGQCLLDSYFKTK